MAAYFSAFSQHHPFLNSSFSIFAGMLNLPLFGLISLLCLCLMDSIIMDQHRGGQRGHSSSLTFMLLQLHFSTHLEWFPPRMGMLRVCSHPEWKRTAVQQRSPERRFVKSGYAIGAHQILQQVSVPVWRSLLSTDSAEIMIPFIGEITSPALEWKQWCRGFPARPPSDTLEYPNLLFLLDTKTDVR